MIPHASRAVQWSPGLYEWKHDATSPAASTSVLICRLPLGKFNFEPLRAPQGSLRPECFDCEVEECAHFPIGMSAFAVQHVHGECRKLIFWQHDPKPSFC